MAGIPIFPAHAPTHGLPFSPAIRAGDTLYISGTVAVSGEGRDMNRAYAEFFPDQPPARYCVQSPLVRDEFLVEIAAIAYLGEPH